MLVSFLAGFAYGLGFGCIVCVLLYVVRSARSIPDGID